MTQIAAYAARCLGKINTQKQKPALRIVGKKPFADPIPVFNLTVEGEEVYFANGVLVHNCQYLCLHADAMQGGRLEKKRRAIKTSSAIGWT